MDHLQGPKNPSFSQIEVPFLGFKYSDDQCIHAESGLCRDCEGKKYRGWNGFPDRMGWSRARILTGDLSKGGQEHPEDAGAFLQAWLYIGLLTAFFGVLKQEPPSEVSDILQSILRKNEDGVDILTTSSLYERLFHWRQSLNGLLPFIREPLLKRVDGLLGQLDDLCNLYLCRDWVDEGYVCPVSEEVSLSIMILGETLNHTKFMIGGSRARYTFGIQKTHQLERILKTNFWCQKDLDNIGCISLVYYASLMGPRYHKLAHEECTSQRCRELDIDEEHYETKHLNEHCKCEHIYAPTEDIINILNQDQTPMLVYVADEKRLVASSHRKDLEGKTYIAISHVWADGLGNPKGNSLPLCQLSRIQSLISTAFPQYQDKLDGSQMPFWMDTLCVPITADGEARKKAITRINATYNNATATLVLDAELMHCSKDCSDTEVALRVIFSRWAQRLWTLQEAVASDTYLFQFADGCVNAGQLQADISKAELINDVLSLNGYKWLLDLSTLHNTTDKDERIVRTFQSTLQRTTSHERDEFICTAGLIGFDQQQISRLLNVAEAERAETFMGILGKASRHLLFDLGPKLSNPGFQWCPQRLLKAWRRVSSNPATANFHTITPHGLRGKWKAIRFQADLTNATEDILSPEIQDLVLVDKARIRCHLVSPSPPDTSTQIMEALKTTKTHGFAILLEELALFEQDYCCLVEVLKEEGSTIFARLVARCFVQLDKPNRHHFDEKKLSFILEEQSGPTENVWCIE